jgi:glycosyltransferase involved in cell wall biosynthesis
MVEVSVIIPTYNSAHYVTTAVESVLAQTLPDIEIIVIDDGSTDGTESVMARFGPPVRYIKQANRGVSSARNRGIAESRGRYIAFLDADDTWCPNKLERQIEALGVQPGSRACFSAFTRVDWDLVPQSVMRCKQGSATLQDLLLRGNVIGSICTVIAERSLFEQAGGFDPELSQCADWDMWVRLAALTDFLYLDEPLVTYRQHESNMSRDPSLLERDSVRVLLKGFAMAQIPADLRTKRRRALARNDVVLAGCYWHARRYREVARCLQRAACLDLRECRHAAAFPLRVACRKLAHRRSQWSTT